MSEHNNGFAGSAGIFGLKPNMDADQSFWLGGSEGQAIDNLEEPEYETSVDPLDDSAKRAKLEQASLLYGVRMNKAGQVFFFPTQGLEATIGTKVLVESEHGQFLGEVVSVFAATDREFSTAELADGDIIAIATAKDIATHTENSLLGAEAAAFCKTCIRQRELEMKLIDVEVLHDRSKIIFFFSAPSRIDFRELVKDLVRQYRTRIELRQIGVRHETQMIGGIGSCGMVCCCHRYLRKFAPVTIKMAKEQNLFLNPAKLSGMCGRLLCCLSFEQLNYENFNKRCPKIGKRYVLGETRVRVLRTNMFSQMIHCITEDNEERGFTLDEWEKSMPERAEPPQDSKQGQSKKSQQKPSAKKPPHLQQAPEDTAETPPAEVPPAEKRNRRRRKN